MGTSLKPLAVIVITASAWFIVTSFILTSIAIESTSNHLQDYDHRAVKDPHRLGHRQDDKRGPISATINGSSVNVHGEQTTPHAATSAKTTATSGTTTSKRNDEPLNILLLYADDWSFTTLGAMGNPVVKTPHLDDMASKGILFTHNCVTTSICFVSRANLYTGQYASRHQTFQPWENLTMLQPDNWRDALHPQLVANGYHVGFYGKWHHSEVEIPHDAVPTFTEHAFAPWEHYIQLENGETMHITEANKLDGMRFLKDRPKDKPFALTISFFATHAEDATEQQYRPMKETAHLYDNQTIPHPKTYTEKHWNDLPHFFDANNMARTRFQERYKDDATYQDMMTKTYRMASEVDTACGELIQMLEQQGVLNSTLVIFTTDNGNMHGQHGLAEKWYAFEESLRVPLIVMDPRMPAHTIGTKNSDFTLSIDLAPTILSAAQISVPSRMQGRDIAELYRNASSQPQPDDRTAATFPPWRQEFWYEFYTPPLASFVKNHKAQTRLMKRRLPSNLALIRKDHKYMYWPDHQYEQIFHLKQDPHEEYDVYNQTPASVVLELRERMEALRVRAVAGHPM